MQSLIINTNLFLKGKLADVNDDTKTSKGKLKNKTSNLWYLISTMGFLKLYRKLALNVKTEMIKVRKLVKL